MRVLLQRLHGLLHAADVPELDLAVVPAAGQVVLAVWVKVQVAHQLTVGVLYTVDLTGEREGEREVRGMKANAQEQKRAG